MGVWVWVALMAFALWALIRHARNAWRAEMRRGLSLHLLAHPDIEDVRDLGGSLVAEFASGASAHVPVQDVYAAAGAPGADPHAVFAAVTAALREHPGILGLTDPDRLRLRPRLLRADDPRLIGGADPVGSIAAIDIGLSDVVAGIVLDVSDGDRLLSHADLDELGVSPAEALQRAVEDLRAVSPPAALIRQVVQRQTSLVCAELDTFDAARLLTLPALLGEGEELYAHLPDRDTLVIAAEPWEPRPPVAGPGPNPLRHELVLVTAEGIHEVSSDIGARGEGDQGNP